MLKSPKIRAIDEGALEAAILKFGGRRAHADADRRTAVGADFLIGDAIIELKVLDEDGLDKVDRQDRLAALFSANQPDTPVVVIDPGRLSPDDLRQYKLIMQGPIKTGIAHAKKQLDQSRREYPAANCSVLMVVNNSFTALTHEELLALVEQRVRNDTSKIDAVVVAGCYLHGDGFDTFGIWPIDAVDIHPEAPFTGYELLRRAWGSLAEETMSPLNWDNGGTKAVEEDKVFERDGVIYIRPARPIGGASKFYVHGRPRKNSTGQSACPPVATSFPAISSTEWRRLRSVLQDPEGLFATFEAWRDHEARAQTAHTDLRPFVAVSVSRGSFEAWRRRQKVEPTIAALKDHANGVFDREVRAILADAREHQPGQVLPRRFIFLNTEEIGQDRGHDVSKMALVEARRGKELVATDLIGQHRLYHEHALALAAAYAVGLAAETVLWRRRGDHAWR